MQETVWIISDTGRLIQRTADAVNNTASVFAQVMSFAGQVCVIIKFCLQLLICGATPTLKLRRAGSGTPKPPPIRHGG